MNETPIKKEVRRNASMQLFDQWELWIQTLSCKAMPGTLDFSNRSSLSPNHHQTKYILAYNSWQCQRAEEELLSGRAMQNVLMRRYVDRISDNITNEFNLRMAKTVWEELFALQLMWKWCNCNGFISVLSNRWYLIYYEQCKHYISKLGLCLCFWLDTS